MEEGRQHRVQIKRETWHSYTIEWEKSSLFPIHFAVVQRKISAKPVSTSKGFSRQPAHPTNSTARSLSLLNLTRVAKTDISDCQKSRHRKYQRNYWYFSVFFFSGIFAIQEWQESRANSFRYAWASGYLMDLVSAFSALFNKFTKKLWNSRKFWAFSFEF